MWWLRLHQRIKTLVEGVRFIERMRASSVDKNDVAEEMAPLREFFTKSIVAEVDLPGGAVLTAEYLTVKKPGTGMPADRTGVDDRTASTATPISGRDAQRIASRGRTRAQGSSLFLVHEPANTFSCFRTNLRRFLQRGRDSAESARFADFEKIKPGDEVSLRRIIA